MMKFYRFDTPVGPLALGEEGGALVRLWLPGQPVPDLVSAPTPLLREGEGQLLAYLAGERERFELPLAPAGTEFQGRVWRALLEIPYGRTRSYGELAREIGCPGGARAVGLANNRNPLPILIPCHRVVGAGGQLTGYAGGLELKEKLLGLERGEKLP